MNYAITLPDTTLFRVLADNNCSIETDNSSGLYPLTLAASWGEELMVKRLLLSSRNLDIQNRTRYRSTALMETTRDGHYTIAESLLNHGAAINCLDTYHDNALHWAVFWGKPMLVRLFLSFGANVHQKGLQRPDNAMDIAQRMNHKEIIEILQKAGVQPSR